VMLYSCQPLAARHAGGARRTAGSAGRPFAVDIHCHVYIPAADAVVGDAATTNWDAMHTFSNEATREFNRKQMATIREPLTSVERRLADMDRMGVDVQALSPSPPQYYYSMPPDIGRAAARIVNDGIAEIVTAHPDRFVGLGSVPMQAPELAVQELERMVKQLGFRGVEISTNVAGAELSEPQFRKFFAKAEELGALVFLHPNGFSDGRRLSDHYLINVIGNPLESTIAVSHLIFDGVIAEHPKLKICVAHGGGYLPAYAARMDHAHAARADCRRVIKRKPSSYLKKLYFDTVVFSHAQLEYLVAQYGADRILLGTDYPFDMAMTDPVGFVERSPKLKRAEKTAIEGGNAARLLKIRVPKGRATVSREKRKSKKTGR
jgi:aminocarboxymuconate-semialdehyde decarboxylase